MKHALRNEVVEGIEYMTIYKVNADKGVKFPADVEITDTTKGVILTAPDASRWRITVDNSGNLTTTSI